MNIQVDLDAVAALLHSVAADYILPRFRRLAAHEVREKAPGNLVTVADLEAERALMPALQALIPGSLVVGEEAVAQDPAVLGRLAGDEPVWIIDPVDGTMNFAKADPRFAVIVALTSGDQIRAGWIHDPLRSVTAAALAGGGAWLLQPGGARRPLRRRDMPPLGEAHGAAYGRIGDRGRAHDILRRSGRLGELRRINSAGQEYIDLVEGRLDFALFGRSLPWDHAAGVLIYREAGGVSRFLAGPALEATPYTPRHHTGLLLSAPSPEAWTTIRDILLSA